MEDAGIQEKDRRRWREAVLEDLKDKGIADWKRKGMDRKNWKRITKTF